MSFILDAIAKSERERQQQEVPDARILATPIGDVPARRRMLPYLLTAALLLNVIVLVIWLQGGASSDWFHRAGINDQAAVSSPSSAEQGLILQDAGAPLTPTTDSDSAAPGSATQGLVNRQESLQPVAVPAAPTEQSSDNVVMFEEVPVKAQGIGGAKPSRGTIDAGQPAPQPAPSAQPVKGAESELQSTASSQLADEAFLDPNPRKASRLSDLPADVRRDLPAVNFTGHLYVKGNANASFVLVDGGRTVTVGQQIANDLFLYEVTPTGVVVDFRGFLIEVGVLQNWSLR